MSTAIAIQQGNEQIQRVSREQVSADPFEPKNWAELHELATMISKTDFAPKDFKGKPEACAIAMMYGRQLGIGGLQAIQNIAVINGKPSVYGDLFWAIITSHPDFLDCVENVTDEEAVCTLTRRGQTPKTVTFSKKDAQLAGLWGKAGPWTQYPKGQMQWRARTFAGRFLFADALKGLTSSHEAADYTAGPTIDAKTQKKGTSNLPTAATITTEQAPPPVVQTTPVAAETPFLYNKPNLTCVPLNVQKRVAKDKKEFMAVKLNGQLEGLDMAFCWHVSLFDALELAKDEHCQFEIAIDGKYMNIVDVLAIGKQEFRDGKPYRGEEADLGITDDDIPF